MYVDGYSLGISKMILWVGSVFILLVLIVGWFIQSVYAACSSQSASYNVLINGYTYELEGATLLMNTIENISYKNIDTISGARELDEFLRGDTRPRVVTLNDLVGEHRRLMNINIMILESASGSSDRYLEISRQIANSSGNFDHLVQGYQGDYANCLKKKESLPFYGSFSQYYARVFGWFHLDQGLPIE